jgi:hypothetical protein
MIYLVKYGEEDLEVYANNPVEYMNRNEIDIYGVDRRYSISTIITQLANNGLFVKLL